MSIRFNLYNTSFPPLSPVRSIVEHTSFRRFMAKQNENRYNLDAPLCRKEGVWGDLAMK